MKKLITLAVVAASIAYLAKRSKKENVRLGGIEYHDIEAGEPILSLRQHRAFRKQEQESERIRNKILSGGTEY
ncbi:hypothetical protein ACFOU0_05940 [Salinicoccus sesuvii]|uniref:Uncharacterized protein n=1 Tax=Salinicoccus sesuvii TaxID=868281 RepID=A0ABV7N3E3_9STAP